MTAIGTDRDALAADIDEQAAELDRLGVLLEAGPLAPDLRSELTLLARAVLVIHDRQMPLMVALQRGGEATADLAVKARHELTDRGHRYASTWLRKHIDDGGFPDYDADAVAVVALGSLLAYAAQKQMFYGAPLDLDEDRFVNTWVEAWLRVASTAEAERDAAGA